MRAFSAEDGEISDVDRGLLERMADFLIRRRVAEPAIVLLETCRPLNFVSAQVLVFLRPFVHLVYKKREEYDRFTELLEKRAALSAFIEIIETRLAADHGHATRGDAP